MNLIYIGKIVNTHALKGEVRIISNFEFKDRVFKIGNKLYVGESKDELTIESYRVHKQFDMVKFKGIDYINDVLKYKGNKVYFDKEMLELGSEEVLIDELINMNVFSNDKLIGRISEYRDNNGNKMIRVNGKFIPFNKDFIVKIDKENNKIIMNNIEVFL